MKKIIFTIFLFLLTLLLLIPSVKGDKGSPVRFQTNIETSVGSPFESTNSSSRYALVKSIVENKSFFLSTELARYSAPDVVYTNNKFISIFTPGVSFIGIPFYIFGLSFGLPQLFTYFAVSVFALVNVFLIFKIGTKLGASFLASVISGLVFLFATNAFAYSQSLTQHHMSVTVILFSIFLLFGKVNLIKSVLLGFLVGYGLLIDIPNPMLMLPILIYFTIKHIKFEKAINKITTSVNIGLLGVLIGLIPLIVIFAWYNKETTGSYATIGQSLGQSNYFDTEQQKVERAKRIESRISSVIDAPNVLPFNTRRQINGFYTLLISEERAWIYYSPIIFIGFLGMFFLYKNKNTQNITTTMLGVIFLNILLYGSFSDPWGGWSFGPRYLIPSAAILSIGIAVVIDRYVRNWFFNPIFVVGLIYSVYINTLGVLTTSAVPPRIEAINLPTPIPYDYGYNLDLVNISKSSSLLYNLYLKDIFTVNLYLLIYTGVICFVIISLFIAIQIKNKKVLI